jgi:predicted porin
MKKTLIALAVASTFVAPAAFAASANVDFYGKFRVSLDHIDNSIGWQMNDQTSRIGFKGAEDLGGGMKAIYQWETGFNPGTVSSTVASTGTAGGTYTSGTSAGGLGNQRDTFIGLAGDFGTVLAGRHDTPYKMAGSADLFGDTAADAQNGGTFCIICEDLRASNAIAYVSPSMSGFTAVGAIVTGHGAQSTTTTKSLNSLADAYSLAGLYNNGPLSLSAGYENLDHIVGNGAAAGKQSAWKLNGSYTIESLKLGATYEAIDKIGGIDGLKQRDYLLSAAYGMGPITLAAQYGYRNYNSAANAVNNPDLTDATIGVVYSMSKRTSTYIGYAHYKTKDASSGGVATPEAKYNVVTLGLNHDF